MRFIYSFILSSLLANSLFAAKPIGLVLDCFGQCFQDNNNFSRSLKYGRSIYGNKEVSLKNRSILWILLFDGSLLKLGSNSTITINRLMKNNYEKKSLVEIYLKRGALSFIPRKIKVTKSLSQKKAYYPLFDSPANDFWDEFDFLNEEKGDQREIGKFRFERLTSLVKANSRWFKILENEVMISTPYLSVFSSTHLLNVFHEPFYASWINEDSISKNIGKFSDLYLSHNNYQKIKLVNNHWYKIFGKWVQKLKSEPPGLALQFSKEGLFNIFSARERSIKKLKLEFMKGSILTHFNYEKILLNIQKRPLQEVQLSDKRGQKKLENLIIKNSFTFDFEYGDKYKKQLIKILTMRNEKRKLWTLKNEIGKIREQTRKKIIDFRK